MSSEEQQHQIDLQDNSDRPMSESDEKQQQQEPQEEQQGGEEGQTQGKKEGSSL
jgi:hypothetical protein